MSEKAYEKHAWIFLFAVGAFGVFIATVFILTSVQARPDTEALRKYTGLTWDELVSRVPGYANYSGHLVRETGLFILGLGVFLLFVSATSYRKGERLAWYAMLSFVLIALASLANDAFSGEVITPGWFVLPPALLGLLLPIRKFFPKS